jgi:hypothetical protein
VSIPIHLNKKVCLQYFGTVFLMDFVKNVPCLHCCVEEQCREWWKSQMTGSLLDRKKI